MQKNIKLKAMTMKSNDLGNILGGLLSGDMKEVKFEITCRMVDGAKASAEEDAGEDIVSKSDEDAVIVPAVDDQQVPRPYSKVDRIDGIGGLAKFLGCAVSTAQKMKNRREVPFYERGVRVFFYKDEIAKALGPKSRYAKTGKEAACVR